MAAGGGGRVWDNGKGIITGVIEEGFHVGACLSAVGQPFGSETHVETGTNMDCAQKADPTSYHLEYYYSAHLFS